MANHGRNVAEARGHRLQTLPLSDDELVEIQGKIGIVFRNPQFLARAFIHRSFPNERRGAGIENNERLEFLGDKVLGFAVGQYLFRNYPEMQEGKLTALQSSLVNTRMLGQVADDLNLATYIRVSQGIWSVMRDHKNKTRNYILACTFEALVCVIYFDRGQGTVELFLGEVLFPRLKEIIEKELYLDPKSYLQMLAQEKHKVTPHYILLGGDGPAHDRSFVAGAFIGERFVGRGEGSSRVEAETRAARVALDKEFGVKLHEGLL